MYFFSPYSIAGNKTDTLLKVTSFDTDQCLVCVCSQCVGQACVHAWSVWHVSMTTRCLFLLLSYYGVKSEAWKHSNTLWHSKSKGQWQCLQKLHSTLACKFLATGEACHRKQKKENLRKLLQYMIKHLNIKKQNFFTKLNLSGSVLQQHKKRFWHQSCAKVTCVKGQICRNPVFLRLDQITNPKRSVIYQREQISGDLHQACNSTAACIESIHHLQITHTHTSSSFPLHMESQRESQRSLSGSVRLRTRSLFLCWTHTEWTPYSLYNQTSSIHILWQ